MRSALVKVNGHPAGMLHEVLKQKQYQFVYFPDYTGAPVSLTLPVQNEPYDFQHFPAFFDGLLPEGGQLDALLKLNKLDSSDYFGQLLAIGQDVVGNVTVETP